MTTPPPVPPDTDAAAFMTALRDLKVWSGLSYRQLERRAARAGHVLPHSTVATMLGRDRLPREELVALFVAACGMRADEAQVWLDARVSIAYGRPAEAAPTTKRGGRSWRPHQVLAGAAVALTTVLLAGVAGVGVLTDEVEVVQPPASLLVPRS
ncbi:hypothetical protein ACIQNG_18915 [Streptomyces sp. NPDC091377]|uniref:hypothetical protein n=1 Tax=Streptomyces sp. NPDC091377 TaxID=3365995 RepID=UPI0037F46A87